MKTSPFRILVTISIIIVAAWLLMTLLRVAAWILNGLVAIAAIVLVIAIIYRAFQRSSPARPKRDTLKIDRDTSRDDD